MKAINKDFIREIKGSKSRFLSILVLVALAVAFLSGLKATAPDMKLTGHNYLEQQKLADVQIMSTVGLTDEDLEKVLELDQVMSAENCYVIDAFAGSGTSDKIAKVYSIPEKEINELLLMEGRMPQTKTECVVEELALSDLGVFIGDKIKLNPQESMEDALVVREFTVVGTVRSPIYVSVERGSASIGTGSVALYMAIPKECFDTDIYTTMFIRLNKPESMIAFYNDYDDYVDDFIDGIEDFGNERAQSRYKDLEQTLDDAQKELDDARVKADKELNDAQAKLDDANRQIQKGKKEIADADIEIADAEEKISKAAVDIADGEQKITDAEKEIADGEAELADALKELEDGEKEYEDGLKKWQKGRDQWYAGAEALAEGSRTLNAQETLLNEGQARLDLFRDMIVYSPYCAMLGLDENATTDEVITSISALAEFDPIVVNSIDEEISPSGMSFADIVASNEQIKEGRAQIASGRNSIAAGNAQLDISWEEISQGKKDLKKARKELDDGWAEYNDGLKELEDGKKELEDAKKELEGYKADLEKGRADLEDAKLQLADAKKELSKGEKEYRDGLAEYNDAKADAEREIADAQQKIDDAREDLDDITEIKWYIFSRSYNPGYTGLGQDADRMGNLSSVFPVIFFLVAALVCLTTMTRMVEEQRIQIGGLKALGYGKLAISRKYIGYGFFPSIIGSVIGLAIGYTLFPSMIFTAYQIMYQMPDIEIHTYNNTSAACIVAAVACTTLASLAACLTTLRETPAHLMVPKTPQAGKRVFLERVGFVWKKLSFIWKVTVRNLFRYKKRFWMTVIGIGGCTALIIAGFGLRYSLTYTMHRQYDELFHYHAQISISNGLDEDDKKAIKQFLDTDERIVSYSNLRLGSMTASSETRSQSMYLYVMETEDIPDYVDLYKLDTGEPITVEDDGIYIDQKLSELLGVNIGDEVFLDGDSKAYARIAGIFEHYTGHFCYMTPKCYEETFREDYEYNGMLMHFTDDSEEFCNGVFADLMKYHGVAGTSRMLDIKDTYLQSMERVDFVVVIIILSAGALALVVLYNLSNINITERRRELATIKVLGFYDKEVSAYVYRENVFLTIFGTALGILMGHYLHIWLVYSTEIDIMMFGRQTDSRSYIFAAGLTILFAVIANLMAHYKMKHIDMVESLKSVE